MRPRHARFTDGIRVILPFAAVSSNDIDFHELDIEWLNASTNSSSLRAILRKQYVDKVVGVVGEGDDVRKAEFDLLALTRCIVRATTCGGPGSEKKHFDDDGAVAAVRGVSPGSGAEK